MQPALPPPPLPLRDLGTGRLPGGVQPGFFPPPMPPFPPPPAPVPVPPAPVPCPPPPMPPIYRLPGQEQPWATKADVERELGTVREKVRHALDLIGDEPPACVNDVVARQERIINTLKEIVA